MKLNTKNIILISASLVIILSGIYLLKKSKALFSVQTTLNLAGSNRTELEKVLKHYEKAKDSLRLRAAEFLITNMVIKGNQLVDITTKNGDTIEFNPLQHSDIQSVQKARDSIAMNYRINTRIFYDCMEIRADYLIKNIDEAFSIWETSQWKDKVPFNTFCEYILPYRVKSEPISDWRKMLITQYKHVMDSLPSNSKIIEACRAINKEMGKNIVYDKHMEYQFNLHRIPDLVKLGSAQCDDLASYGCCTMRAFGIPATVDYTLWAKYNNGHVWCVMFDENGKAWSFQTGEQQAGEHINIFTEPGKEYRRLAKVFRITYSIQPSTLASIASPDEEIPDFLKTRNCMDVTNEYTKTYDIRIKLDKCSPKQKYAYICVFNMGAWKPIYWGEAKKAGTVFKNMGTEVIYIAAYYFDGSIQLASEPFKIEDDGKVVFLRKGGNKLLKLSKKDLIKSRLAFRNEYSLYRWEDKNWILQSVNNLQPDSSIQFSNVMPSKLYKLDSESRIFTIENNNPVWW